MMACSEIGVDLTRSSPNLVDRPLVTPITPPSCLSPTSSPRARTLGSAAMASLMARLIAWTKFSFSVPVIAPSRNIMREHVALEFENVRVCGRVGRFYRTRYRCCAGLFDCDQFVLACDPVSDQAFAQDGHRIVRQRLGIFCLVDVAASITDQMTVETESHGLDQCGPFSSARAFNRDARQSGRAHVCTPVHNAQLVCR